MSEQHSDVPDAKMVASRWRELAGDLGPAVTRFAPSPTGQLHLGHLLHLRWLNSIAQAVDARVIVRIEDHDQARCSSKLEKAILSDLDWLGFEFDDTSRRSLASSQSPYRQSDNPSRYQDAFDLLLAAGLLYGCTCTRGDLPAPDNNGDRNYPGTCRGKLVVQDGKHVVRVMLPEEFTEVDDLLHGTIRQHPARDHGDLIVRDALGQWTYQFAVVVDDMAQGVNLIVRGNDLIHTTGRHALLGKLLGRTTRFVTAHHPLLLDEYGRKLSKRDQSTSVRVGARGLQQR